MNNFAPVGSVNVSRLLIQLKKNPHLWDLFKERSFSYGSPHGGVSDIWVRFRNRDEFNGDWAEFVNSPHEAVWYDSADALSATRDIAFQLMAAVRGERLGGILITKVPPGGEVKPHVDGGYNARTYDKFAVILESAEGQGMFYEDGRMAGPPGSVFWFRNDVPHWVKNESDIERITMIICIQPEGRALCHSQP